MTQIFTRLFRFKLIVIPIFLLCNFAIVSQARKNQKSAHQTSANASGDFIDYDHLLRVDYQENGVSKTYYHDTVKNILYFPEVGYYLAITSGDANSLEIKAESGRLPTDFVQKISVAQNSAAQSNSVQSVGVSNQPGQSNLAELSDAQIAQVAGYAYDVVMRDMQDKALARAWQHAVTASLSFREQYGPSQDDGIIVVRNAGYTGKNGNSPTGSAIAKEMRANNSSDGCINELMQTIKTQNDLEAICNQLRLSGDRQALAALKQKWQDKLDNMWWWTRRMERGKKARSCLGIVKFQLGLYDACDVVENWPLDKARAHMRDWWEVIKKDVDDFNKNIDRKVPAEQWLLEQTIQIYEALSKTLEYRCQVDRRHKQQEQERLAKEAALKKENERAGPARKAGASQTGRVGRARKIGQASGA